MLPYCFHFTFYEGFACFFFLHLIYLLCSILVDLSPWINPPVAKNERVPDVRSSGQLTPSGTGHLAILDGTRGRGIVEARPPTILASKLSALGIGVWRFPAAPVPAVARDTSAASPTTTAIVGVGG